MPSKRSGIVAAAISNSLFVSGGEDLIKTYGNNEEYGTQDDGKWISPEPMPTCRHGLAAVSVDDRIFVIGGGPKPFLSVSDVNEIYTIK